jgi:hypothetical protein
VPPIGGVSPIGDSKEERLQQRSRRLVLRSPPAQIDSEKDEQRPESERPHLDERWCRRDRPQRTVDVLPRMIRRTRARKPQQDKAGDREQDEDQERHPFPQVLERDHGRKGSAGGRDPKGMVNRTNQRSLE